jgi:membrane protease YdiL (CAAX protease family)
LNYQFIVGEILMKKETRNLVIFFLATFIWTWAFYTPIVISSKSPYQMPWMILLILGGAGPSIVGVVMAMLTSEKGKRGEYWRRCFSLKRISGLWWVLIFLIFPLIYIVTILVDRATGAALPGMEQLKGLMANPITWPLAAFISFMSGPWSEEFGWRGYALEPLLKRTGNIRGSIIMGMLWGVWHLPLFFMPATWHGQMGFKLAGFWTFILMSIGLSLIMTWIYQNTNRSILAGMLLHFGSNFTGQLLAPISDRTEVVKSILYFVVGLTACLLINRRTRPEESKNVTIAPIEKMNQSV